jgi:hypothetical protein
VLRRASLPIPLLVFCFLFVSCDAAWSWTSDLASEPAIPPPMSIVLAIDHSVGSTAGQVELAANVEAVLATAAVRPHSTVSLWSLGADVASTTELARVESPAPSNRGDRARAAQQRQWVESSRADLLRAARVIIAAEPHRSSPIAEGISAISLSRAGPDGVIVVSTDALQCTRETFDFECKKLPETSAFLARLKALSLLTPGSLAGTRVVFANARIGEVGENRCPMTISRIATVRSLWSAAITNAGGTVTFTTDSVTSKDLGGAE